MSEENRSLLDGIFYLFNEEVKALNFGDMFTVVADSVLTSFLLFFIASWIFSICVSLGRKGWK